MTDKQQLVNELNETLAHLTLTEGLKALRNAFDGRIVFSTSLGLEDQVISDGIFANNIDIEVFTLDTGRNFPETYTTLEETQRKYGRTIHAYYPQTQAVEQYVTENGINAVYGSVELRKQCCQIRKIEPLNRALAGAQVWITGLRAAQSAYRAGMGLFEYDEGRDLIKFQPVLNWSTQELWDYVAANEVPFNALHKAGFPSIGCAPCTRAIAEGEDERAGRWWWEQVDKKECGLHFDNGKLQRTAA